MTTGTPGFGFFLERSRRGETPPRLSIPGKVEEESGT